MVLWTVSKLIILFASHRKFPFNIGGTSAYPIGTCGFPPRIPPVKCIGISPHISVDIGITNRSIHY
ncbi:hypothetical protein PEC106568_37080 [Pectobacterium carotovorum subsp. carotovorum]|nr:hypothetical protein PEC106568_37080 [Pectobacterium carotovorum subsp. carotovorum]